MRIIIYGVGAIGGVVAGCLVRAGTPVIGIARGKRLAALREHGLMLRTPAGSERIALDCRASAVDIDWQPSDTVVVAVKGQDTAAAVADLRSAGVTGQPIFSAQNGVANERALLRHFSNVHGVTVMMPAEYMAPDEAVAFGAPNQGIFDLGRYPQGSTDDDTALADALTAAGIAGFVMADVMASKYGKLLLNLGNIVEAALGRGTDGTDITEALRAEARGVLTAAGIAWRDVGASDPRRDRLMKIQSVDGAARIGGSSTQSLARGAGSIETDYLNGEIALIARLTGGEAPLNAAATALAARLARDKRPPGALKRDELAAALGLPAVQIQNA